MTRLESGALWHQMSEHFQAKYHGGDFVLQHRFGFDIGRLSHAELMRYVMVYTATMQARGQHQGVKDIFNKYLQEIVSESNKKRRRA